MSRTVTSKNNKFAKHCLKRDHSFYQNSKKVVGSESRLVSRNI